MHARSRIGRLLIVAAALCAGAQGFAADAPEGPRTFVLCVIDKTNGEPVVDAQISCQIGPTAKSSVATDDAGKADIALPAAPEFLSVSIKSTGYVPMSLYWNPKQNSADRIPMTYTLALEPGLRIGGTVVDDAGQPVEGASVQLAFRPSPQQQKARPNERTNISYKSSIQTDKEGKWTFTEAPADLAHVSVGVYHVRYANEAGFYPLNEVPNGAGLRDGTYRRVLPRGKLIRGTVTGPDGKPVRGAGVGFGGDRVASNVLPEVKTDADGKFEIGCKAGVNVVLTVKAKGYAPDLQEFVMPADTDRDVTFKLEPAKVLNGRVVGTGGKPIAQAWVYIDSWRGHRTIMERLRTDFEGRFSWTGAPADEVVGDVDAQGWARKRDIHFLAGQEIEVRLVTPAVVRGTVVDDETGTPIKAFTIIDGIGFNAGQPINWQRRAGDGREQTGVDGAFQRTITMPYPILTFRIEADGYAPADSKTFSIEDGDQNLTFRLHRAAPLTGTVTDDAGKSVEGASVVLMVGQNGLQISNGKIPDFALWNYLQVITGADGGFSFPAQTESYQLVAVAPQGIGRFKSSTTQPTTAPTAEARAATPTTQPASVVIQAWGTVKGVAMIGSKPAAGEKITATPFVTGNEADMPARIFANDAVTVGADGSFRIDHVLPGDVMVGRQIQLPHNMTSTTDNQRVHVDPGATVDVRIGGTGRPVAGQLTLPDDLKARTNWTYTNASLSTKINRPEVKIPDEVKKMSPADMQAWYMKWSATDAGKAFLLAEKKSMEHFVHFPIRASADGTWQVDDVPAGTYTVQFSIANMKGEQPDYNKPLFTATADVTVPDMPGGRSDDVLVVPALELKPFVARKQE